MSIRSDVEQIFLSFKWTSCLLYCLIRNWMQFVQEQTTVSATESIDSCVSAQSIKIEWFPDIFIAAPRSCNGPFAKTKTGGINISNDLSLDSRLSIWNVDTRDHDHYLVVIACAFIKWRESFESFVPWNSSSWLLQLTCVSVNRNRSMKHRQ